MSSSINFSLAMFGHFELIMSTLTTLKRGIGPSGQYLISLRSKRSRVTIKSVLNQVARVLGYQDHEDVPWGDVDTLHVNGALTAIKERKDLSPVTLNLYLSAIKGVFKHGWNAGAISFESHQRISSIPQYPGSRIKRKKVTVDDEFVEGLISSAYKLNTLTGYRNAAILGLLAYAGLRREEVTALKMTDIDMAGGQFIIRGKGDKERLGFINEPLAVLLSQWFSQFDFLPLYAFFKLHKHNAFVEEKVKLSGNAIYDVVKAHGDAVGEPNLYPHALRAYFGTTLLNNGVDIVTVRDLMGHKSFSTTEIYIRRDDAKLRAAAGGFKSSFYSNK